MGLSDNRISKAPCQANNRLRLQLQIESVTKADQSLTAGRTYFGCLSASFFLHQNLFTDFTSPSSRRDSAMAFEIHNVGMKVGDTLKIKGKISDDANRFSLNLGNNSENIALHFNPRFEDADDGAVIVCNSKCDNCWDSEQRESNFPFAKGEKFKLNITLKGDTFEVRFPDDFTIEFPNRLSLNKIDFLSVDGDVKLVSFGHK